MRVDEIEAVYRALSPARKVAPAVINQSITLQGDGEERSRDSFVVQSRSIGPQIVFEIAGGRFAILVVASIDREDSATVLTFKALTNALLGVSRLNKNPGGIVDARSILWNHEGSPGEVGRLPPYRRCCIEHEHGAT